MILDQTWVSCIKALQAGFLPTEPWEQPTHAHIISKIMFPLGEIILYTHKNGG